MRHVSDKDIAALAAIRAKREIIEALHSKLKLEGRWLHKGQQLVARKIFQEGKKVLQCQWGRNGGKSFTAAYVTTRYAIENPGSQCYIVAPERKQAYEIYWASGLIQNMVPRELLLDGDDGLNKSELRLYLKNGSFIKLDGSDNHKALRGYKPDFIVCDEFQDWLEEAWIAMEPNLLAKNAVCFCIGTPPDRECFYTRRREFVLSEVRRANKRYFYMECPTALNPIFTEEMLDEIKRGFIERQEEAIWRREYMAEYVPGGAKAVWGTLWSRRKFTRPKDELVGLIFRDIGSWRFFTIADPGTTSCFAVLFAAYNPYSQSIILLDEIYEKDRTKTSSSQIWDRIIAKEQALYPNHPPRTWFRIADEAAAWFINEISHNYREAITPTQKGSRKKDQNVSLAKDIMFHDKLRCSSTLDKFFYEMDNFVTKDNGDFPDEDDHLIDTFLYLIAGSGYSFVERSQNPDELVDRKTRLIHNVTRNDWDTSVPGVEQYDFDVDWMH